MFFRFPKAAALREGDEENDRALRFKSKAEVKTQHFFLSFSKKITKTYF